MNRILSCLALASLASVAAAQVPFNFPVPADASAVLNGRGALRLTLDVTGDPVLFCWKDDGLFEKGCAAINPLDSAGYSGFRPDASSDVYDIRSLQLTYSNGAWNAEPDWSLPIGCVVGVDIVSNLRRLYITNGSAPAPTEVTCDTAGGGVLATVCGAIAEGDCGSFEGHYVGTQIILEQILARRGFFGY